MTAAILKLNELSEDSVVSRAVDILQSGRLVVVPTETVYGVAAQIDRADSLELIFRAKSRDRGKPVPILGSDLKLLRARGFEMSERELLLADAFWPGALTMILSRGGSSEGVRIPDHSLALKIIAGCGGLLRVTSANQSGDPPALNAEMAFAALGSDVDLIIDGGRVSGGVPSTVIKCHNAGFDILREGAISSASIAAKLESI